MINGIYGRSGRLAATAAAGLFAAGLSLSPAQAADLGGDCCADLEERVAELEATTVRKGNTKMSLKLRGQVNKSILFWDDGVNDDVYVGDNGESGTKFILQGNAKVSSGLEIGFFIEYDIQTNEISGLDQVTANLNGPDIVDGSDEWVYFKGDWGRISVGRNDDANQGIAEIDLSGTGLLSDASPLGSVGSFFIDGTGLAGATWGSIVVYDPGDGGESEIVKYDTPTFAGFTLSASWGAGADAATPSQEEKWDVALRFARDFGDVLVAAGVGAGQTQTDTDHWGASASILHVPTGLSLSGSVGNSESGTTVEESDSWHVKVGLQQSWTPLGKTAIYGDYGVYERTDTGGVLTDDREVNVWSFGLVQSIDAAATDLYIGYKHFEVEEGGAVATDGEEFDRILAGARVSF